MRCRSRKRSSLKQGSQFAAGRKTGGFFYLYCGGSRNDRGELKREICLEVRTIRSEFGCRAAQVGALERDFLDFRDLLI